MKAVFISCYQAFYNEVLDIFDNLEIKGFTSWNEVTGRGSDTGEPHYGSHAWPTLNSALLTILSDDKVKPLLTALHELDLSAPQQGIKAFVLPVDEVLQNYNFKN